MQPSEAAAPRITTTLTNLVVVDAAREYDASDPTHIPLQDVPFTGSDSRPVQGLSFLFGRNAPSQTMPAAMDEAQARNERSGLVTASVDVGVRRPSAFQQLGDLQEQHLMVLPRISREAGDWLMGLIRRDIDEAVEAGGSREQFEGKAISVLVSTYPHLIDSLARHDDLAHVSVFVWQAHEIWSASNIRVGTIYDPSRVMAMRTQGARGVEAVLPDHLAADPALRRAPFDVALIGGDNAPKASNGSALGM